MDEKTATKLRTPFAPELIGKRPQPTCRNCSQSRTKNCDQHNKIRCDGCGQWITSAHIHLDFVGHADITDRFLQVDPDWSWEPFALNERGLPAFDENGGMWIRLTIAGVTRIGYGDAQGKTGPNAVKEAIGDALRNAGMRFGVGLDMWRKESEPDEPQRPAQQGNGHSRPAPVEKTDHDWLTKTEGRIAAASSTQELETIANEIDAKRKVGACEQVHYDHLWSLGTSKHNELVGVSA